MSIRGAKDAVQKATAAAKGAPCVGICANNIAVLAAVNDKIADVDARHAMTFAGVRADGAALVDFVRVHAARERLRLPDEAPATSAGRRSGSGSKRGIASTFQRSWTVMGRCANPRTLLEWTRTALASSTSRTRCSWK